MSLLKAFLNISQFWTGIQEFDKLKIEVVLTANLPAAATAQDGKILIEDGGAGDRNIIIYAGGERFRIDGGGNV